MDEWAIAKDLITVLLQYKNATLFFSQDSTSVAAVIPAMNHILNHLNSQIGKAYHPSIIAAMKLTCKKMDCYYSLTNFSITYYITIVTPLRLISVFYIFVSSLLTVCVLSARL